MNRLSQNSRKTVVYYKEGCEWGYRVITKHATAWSEGFKTKKQAMRDYAKSRWMWE